MTVTPARGRRSPGRVLKSPLALPGAEYVSAAPASGSLALAPGPAALTPISAPLLRPRCVALGPRRLPEALPGVRAYAGHSPGVDGLALDNDGLQGRSVQGGEMPGSNHPRWSQEGTGRAQPGTGCNNGPVTDQRDHRCTGPTAGPEVAGADINPPSEWPDPRGEDPVRKPTLMDVRNR